MNKVEIAIKQAEQRLKGEVGRLEKLKLDKVRADEALINSPSNDDLALRAAALELQVKAQEAGVERARAKAQAERDRLEQPEFRAAVEELEQVNQAGLELTADIIKRLEEDAGTWTRWNTLRDRSEALAEETGMESFVLKMGDAGGWLGEVKRAVKRWHDLGRYKPNGDIPVEVPDDPEGRSLS